jgi:gluconolactonase
MKLRIAAALCGTAMLVTFAAQAQNYSTAALPAPKGGIAAVQGASVKRLDPALDALIAPNAKFERIATGFQFTEGSIWHKGEVWFSDLRANKVYSVSPTGKVTMRLDHAGGADNFDSRFYRGSNGIIPAPDGTLLVAQHSAHRIVKLDDQMRATSFLDKFEGKALNSPNDMVYSQDGALYFSDPPYFYNDPVAGRTAIADVDKAPGKVQKTNNVYRFKDGKLTAVITDLARPNGVGFSPDYKSFYVSNTEPRSQLFKYDVRPDGTLANKKLLGDWTNTGPGVPDGLKVDSRGNIWATGPGGIRIVSPDGKVLGQLVLPEVAANLAFGGNDMKTLYITGSSSIYRVNVNVAGLKPMYSR